MLVKKSLVAAGIVVMYMMFASTVSAQGGYVGIAVGSTNYEYSDQVSHGGEIFAGIDLSPELALEISGWDMGDLDSDSVYDLNVSGVALAAKGSVPLSEQVSVYGKLGWFLWEVNEVYDEVEYGKLESGTDLLVGGGVSFATNEFLNVNIEYKEVDLDGMLAGNWSVGLVYSF